jgi:hypothetical protein
MPSPGCRTRPCSGHCRQWRNDPVCRTGHLLNRRAVVVFITRMIVTFTDDHFVRPVLIGGATKLPFFWVLLGILGGVEVRASSAYSSDPQSWPHSSCSGGNGPESKQRSLRFPGPRIAEDHRPIPESLDIGGRISKGSAMQHQASGNDADCMSEPYIRSSGPSQRWQDLPALAPPLSPVRDPKDRPAASRSLCPGAGRARCRGAVAAQTILPGARLFVTRPSGGSWLCILHFGSR